MKQGECEQSIQVGDGEEMDVHVNDPVVLETDGIGRWPIAETLYEEERDAREEDETGEERDVDDVVLDAIGECWLCIAVAVVMVVCIGAAIGICLDHDRCWLF